MILKSFWDNSIFPLFEGLNGRDNSQESYPQLI